MPEIENHRTVLRTQQMAREIVVVDGLPNSGKAVMAPLISTLKRGELWHMNLTYDYCCILNGLGKMSLDAARTMINLNSDLDLYQHMISRYTNFRKTDVSSAQMNLLAQKYLTRLKKPDGDEVVKRIRKERPILPIMTHHLFAMSEPLFDALGNRLKLFICNTRHPLWLVDYWFQRKWDGRAGKDPREMKMCFKSRYGIFPWYLAGWEGEYSRLGPLDKAVRVIAHFFKSFDQHYKLLHQSERRKVFFVPFEWFVTQPLPFLTEITARLGTKRTALTSKMMARLDVPRKLPKNALDSQKEKMSALMKRESISKRSEEILESLCNDYERKYLAAFRWPSN